MEGYRTASDVQVADESLFKVSMLPVNEICMNFQLFFYFEEFRGAATLKSTAVPVAHVGKQSPFLYPHVKQNAP